MREGIRATLASQEPVAYGKNALLHKELDAKFRLLVKEHKIEQRRTRSVAEKCVTTIYSMLLEAERFAEDNLKRKEEENKKSREPRNIEALSRRSSINKENVTSGKPRRRPMTATGHSTRLTVKNENGRPKSAHPILSQETQEEDVPRSVEDDDVESSDEVPRDNRLMSFSSKAPMNSINAKILQLRLHALKTKAGKKSKMEELKKQNSHDSDDSDEFQVGEGGDDESSCSEHFDTVVRPKTAEYYRKKHSDDERGEYWNRRVNLLIRKWDIEDKGDDYIDRRGIGHQSKYIDKGPPPLMNFNKNSTEATMRKNAFVRKYCGTYRSLLRPSSAPVESHHRRSEKITRQELASIHADTAKRRKNTKAILRKSRRLRMQIESLTLSQDAE